MGGAGLEVGGEVGQAESSAWGKGEKKHVIGRAGGSRTKG